MFESSDFLKLFIPDYLAIACSRSKLCELSYKPVQSGLKVIGNFMKFAHSLYFQLGLSRQFQRFLVKEFGFIRKVEQSKKKSQFSLVNEEKGKILMFIEQTFDKISQVFIELYLKILRIHLQITDNSIDQEAIMSYSHQLVKWFNQTRLYYQLVKIQSENLEDYDDYIQQVFALILDFQIGPVLKQIIVRALNDECANIDEQVIQKIEQLLSQRVNEKAKIGPAEESTKGCRYQKLAQKKNIKSQQPNSSIYLKTKQKDFTIQKILQSPQRRTIKQRQSPSPGKRIQRMVKQKKEKKINKKRTIYYQRRNVYLPKVKSFLSKANSMGTQSTFQSSAEKLTEKKYFKFESSQSTYQDFDCESVLVRSTPKQMKKMSLKMISHRLEF